MLSGMLANMLFKPGQAPLFDNPKNYGLIYENISFEASDRTKLRGWIIPGASDKVIIPYELIMRKLTFSLLAAVFLTACQASNETTIPEKTMSVTPEQTQMLTMLAKGLSTPPRTPVLRTPDEYGMTYEDVSFTTEDGVKITGWFIPASSDKIIISNHFSPANRYGFAGHKEGLDYAGGFEVNFLPRYKALHEAGYNILAYDLRGHGDSADGEDGISGVGYYEWQEVLASLAFVRSHPNMKDFDISLMSMCMGANATINAMDRSPESFKDVKSLIAIAPLKGQTTIERNAERMGIEPSHAIPAFNKIYHDMTGLNVPDHDITKKAGAINVPTFFLQVRDDMNSRWEDVQAIYDATPVADKRIKYIEGTPWRFHGYTYFSEYPEEMVAWFDEH